MQSIYRNENDRDDGNGGHDFKQGKTRFGLRATGVGPDPSYGSHLIPGKYLFHAVRRPRGMFFDGIRALLKKQEDVLKKTIMNLQTLYIYCINKPGAEKVL